MATTKKQRTTMNIVMVVLAAVIVIAGVVLVTTVRGGSSQETPFSVVGKTGYANIERAGISYTLDKGTSLQDGDAIETLNGSELEVAVEGGSQVYLADASQLSVHVDGSKSGTDAHAGSLELTSGSLFADVQDSNTNFSIDGSSTSWTTKEAVFVFSVQSGTVTMQLLSGSAECSDGTSVQAGQSYSMVPNQEKGDDVSVSTLSLASLDSFALSHAESAIAEGKSLCFTTEQIADLRQSRIDEQTQATQTATGGLTVAAGTPAQEAASGAAAATPESPAGTETTTTQTTTNDTAAEVPTATQNDTPQSPAADQLPSCTLQIRCDTILNNMDSLAEGKSKYVPSDGIILQTTRVSFTEGESAFDILKGACDQLGIALEYSYAPLYGSSYVEGIGNLYQFDCGDESGWMYKVNGWFPNYGCSEYHLSDGDAIVFCYTCKGIGADVQ